MLVDRYPSGTVALYTPPLFKPGFNPGLGNTHGGPVREIRPLHDLGLGRSVFDVFQPPKPLFEKTEFATPSKDKGFGTNEFVSIDYNRQERIKTYVDPINDNITIGYETFETNHRKKPLARLGSVLDDDTRTEIDRMLDSFKGKY